MFLVFKNDSPVKRHSSSTSSFLMRQCGCLAVTILFRCRDRDVKSPFGCKCHKVYCLTKGQSCQFFFKFFCDVTFSCWLRIFLSHSVAWVWFSSGSSYTGPSGYVTPVGDPLRRTSNCIHSFPKNANFHCCVLSSNKKAGVIIASFQKASICRGVFLESVADGAMLYCWRVSFVNWATIEYWLFKWGICGAIYKLLRLI